MRNRYLRGSVSLLASLAAMGGSIAAVSAQGFDEGVARTVTGPDAEAGQFEVPETVEQSGYERPVDGAPAIWNPRPSGQFACDLASDRAKGMVMDIVAELPGGEIRADRS